MATKQEKHMRHLLGEAVGTFLLALAVFMSVGPLGALGAGLVLMAALYMGCNTHVAHLNPAVTAGAWFAGQLDTKEFFAYLLAQLVGVFVACHVASSYGAGLMVDMQGLTAKTLALRELISSFVFVSVVASVVPSSEKLKGDHHFGLFIGLTFAGLVMSFKALFNPAIALGYHMFSMTKGMAGAISNELLILVFVPLLGGVLAAWHYGYMLGEKK